jgi:hypothetical protein
MTDRLLTKAHDTILALANEFDVSPRRVQQTLTPERVALLRRADQLLDERLQAAQHNSRSAA